ncbi:MAG: 1-(5-phosphoribosyl)-5-[(5-phosphoribosylamino)methylideneamino]imidazole-4-carboxamide isomerase [Dehalococcoidia bacterium]|nr:1-(5-phosphoribosyl)-5-[(5-phosphoribosylamino)methylideneamino]imidazole-4-carboxamide isomerase [Dehalococcoidia bacterium]
MEVIPAIDLRGGQVVRLYQGDFRQETVYSTDPAAVALAWQQAGAPRIHVVDLDGARAGRFVNLGAIEAIAAKVTVPLQVGGGVRDLDMVSRLVRAGVQRVVLGTAAVRNPSLVRFACQALGQEAVVIGLDVKDGKVAVQGWMQAVERDVYELAKDMAALGVLRFIYTDISADGTLKGPNVQAVADLIRATGAHIIASGGVGSLDDLERLAETGVEGAIVGSALYRGAIDLGEAVRRFGAQGSI